MQSLEFLFDRPFKGKIDTFSQGSGSFLLLCFYLMCKTQVTCCSVVFSAVPETLICKAIPLLPSFVFFTEIHLAGKVIQSHACGRPEEPEEDLAVNLIRMM